MLGLAEAAAAEVAASTALVGAAALGGAWELGRGAAAADRGGGGELRGMFCVR